MSEPSSNLKLVSSPAQSRAIWPLLFLLQFALFALIGQERLIAFDEGFYLMAAKLVMQAKLPYLDFFYPQMPGSPYLIGPLLWLFGYDWQAARIIPAIFTAASGCLVFDFVRRKRGGALAIFALIIFALSDLGLVWFSTLKPYTSSTFFLLLSFYLLFANQNESNPKRIILAGLSAAMAVQLRLYLIVPALLLLAASQLYLGRKALQQYFLGMSIGALPALLLFILAPSQFLFNNIGYHLARNDYAELASTRKFLVLKQIFALTESKRLDSHQFPLLCISAVLLLLRLKLKKMPTPLSFWLSFIIFVVSFLPTPMYSQYLCICLPFLAIFVAEAFPEMIHKRVFSQLIILAALSLLYLKPVPSVLKRYCYSGEGVLGYRTEENESVFKISSVSAVSERIDELSSPGQTVVSEWPGFLFASQARPAAGLENHFGLHAARNLKAQKRREMKIVSRNEVFEILADTRIKIAIAPPGSRAKLYKLSLPLLGFTKQEQVAGVTIYMR